MIQPALWQTAGGEVRMLMRSTERIGRIVESSSADGGRTWTPPSVLEEGHGEYSYPAVIRSVDGAVHVTYTWRRTHLGHLVIDPVELPG